MRENVHKLVHKFGSSETEVWMALQRLSNISWPQPAETLNPTSLYLPMDLLAIYTITNDLLTMKQVQMTVMCPRYSQKAPSLMTIF